MTINSEFIHQLVKEGLKKPFPAPSIIVFRWLLLIAIYFVVLISFSGFRPDILEKINQPIFLIELFSMLLTSILAAIAASFFALPDSNQKPWIRFLPFISLAFLIGVLIDGIYTLEALSLSQCLKLGNYECMIHIALISIIPGLIMFYTIRKAVPVKFYWAGSMAGFSAASFGYVALRLSLNHDDPTSLLIWHFLPVIILAIIGMMLGKFFFQK